MIVTSDGTRITRAQLRKALDRYKKGGVSLRELEELLNIHGHRGKFLRRAWQKELGVTTTRPRTNA